MTPLRRISVPHFLRTCRGFDETLTELRRVLGNLGYSRPFIVTGNKSGGVLGQGLLNALSDDGHKNSYVTSDNHISEVQKVRELVTRASPDVLVGVGGGRVLDVCKYAAAAASLPFISMPTQISNDGICSPVAVLKNEEGKTSSMGARIPVAIIIDLDVVAESPDSTIRAGVGDLVSNLMAVADWRLASQHTGEHFDDYAAIVAATAASSIYEAEDGLATLPPANGEAPMLDLHDERFLALLVNGLVLSGIAMELCGTSRPCSGAEHKISHALDAYFDSPASHGEQVALGSVVSAYLHGHDWQRMKRFFVRVGLPGRPEDIGLTCEQFAGALSLAPGTRKDRYTILEHAKLTEQEALRMVGEIWQQ